jgi:hypothetical protein
MSFNIIVRILSEEGEGTSFVFPKIAILWEYKQWITYLGEIQYVSELSILWCSLNSVANQDSLFLGRRIPI